MNPRSRSALVLRLALNNTNQYEIIDTPPSPQHLTGGTPAPSERKRGSDGPGYIECLEAVLTPYDEETDEFTIHIARYRPEELHKLASKTKFTKKEIQLMYRGFKQECPTGMVDEVSFKHIFAQFFPLGDATNYAHYVFNTIKQKQSEKISFEDFLNILSKVSRGTIQEKLQWVFGLYDLNGDGLISKSEMVDVVTSIYEMLGRATQPIVEDNSAKEHVERIFHLIDTNKDGVITIEELITWVSRDERFLKSLETLDTVL